MDKFYVLKMYFTTIDGEDTQMVLGYFENLELAEEAEKELEPKANKLRESKINNELKSMRFYEDIETERKELEELYSDEFILIIEDYPMNTILRNL